MKEHTLKEADVTYPEGYSATITGIAGIPQQVRKLRIVRYGNEPSVLLIYLNADGGDIADTFHNSVRDAQATALEEFGSALGGWREINLITEFPD